MAYTSRCPACSEHVAVPDGLNREREVRCPVCEKEFPLGEVGEPVADAPDFAPELVPVTVVDSEAPMLDIWKDQRELVEEVPVIELGSMLRKPGSKKSVPRRKEEIRDEVPSEPAGFPQRGREEAVGDPPQPEDEVTVSRPADSVEEEPLDATDEHEDRPRASEIESSGEIADENDNLPTEPAEVAAATEVAGEAPPDRDVLIRCPHCEVVSKLTELIFASSGDHVRVDLLAVALGLHSASEASEPSPDALEHGIYDVATTDFVPGGPAAGEEDLPAGNFSFAGRQHDSGSGSAVVGMRRRKSQKSLLKEMLGAGLGAVLAVPIAYYVLNLIGGERFDKVPVPLPFCPHTYDHLPSDWPEWWPNWAKVSAPAPPLVPVSEVEPEEIVAEPAADDPEIQETFRRLDEARLGASPSADPAAADHTPRPEPPQSAAKVLEPPTRDAPAVAVEGDKKPPVKKNRPAPKAPTEKPHAGEGAAKKSTPDKAPAEKPAAEKPPLEKAPADVPLADTSPAETPPVKMEPAAEASPLPADSEAEEKPKGASANDP